MYLIDTNVAIYLRDREPTITGRIADLAAPPKISIMTWVELENGVARDSSNQQSRRRSLDVLLERIPILDVDRPIVLAYRDIVFVTGYSRARVTDRLIAATALAYDLALVTINGADFRDVPSLELVIWRDPYAQ